MRFYHTSLRFINTSFIHTITTHDSSSWSFQVSIELQQPVTHLDLAHRSGPLWTGRTSCWESSYRHEEVPDLQPFSKSHSTVLTCFRQARCWLLCICSYIKGQDLNIWKITLAFQKMMEMWSKTHSSRVSFHPWPLLLCLLESKVIPFWRQAFPILWHRPPLNLHRPWPQHS